MMKRLLVILMILAPVKVFGASGMAIFPDNSTIGDANEALQKAVAALDVAGVEKALKQGANPNIPKDTRTKIIAIGGTVRTALADPVLLDVFKRDKDPRAFEIAKLLMKAGAKITPAIEKIIVDILNQNTQQEEARKRNGQEKTAE